VVHVKRLVCVEEEVFERVKRLLEELKPALVVEVAEPPSTKPATATAKTLREMILSVMKPGEEYAADKVARLIRERYGVEVERSSVSMTMCRLTKKGKLKRAGYGVYQLAE
jgi:RNase P/RNase MRP subunit p30